MGSRYAIVLLAFFVVVVLGCAQQQAEQHAAKPAVANTNNAAVEKPSAQSTIQPKMNPTLAIVSPIDGEIINSSSINIVLQADNFELVPAGQPVKDGHGHFNVWLDSDKQIGSQTTFVFGNIASGKHAVVAELVRSDNSSLNPRVLKAIAINVNSGYTPNQEQVKQSAAEFAVEADDNGFYPSNIQAKMGDNVTINFRFRDSSIYFAGLDVKGPFQTLHYKTGQQQPLRANFVMDGITRIDSYWPSTGIHKATLIVEAAT